MQNYHDRSDSGPPRPESNLATTRLDGDYFREDYKNGLNLDMSKSNYDRSKEINTPLKIKSRQTTQSSEDLLSGPFSPWARNSSNEELSPSHSFNTSLAFSNNGHWSSPVREKSPVTRSGGNRGPLDTSSPLIDSPVSSTEDYNRSSSILPSQSPYYQEHFSVSGGGEKRKDLFSALDSHWTPKAQNLTYQTSGISRPRSNELLQREEEQEAALAAAYQQNIQDALELANRRSNNVDLQRTYSAGYITSDLNRLGSENNWHGGQRSSVPGGIPEQQPFGFPLRSLSSTTTPSMTERMNTSTFNDNKESTALYKSYQPDLQAMHQYTQSQLQSMEQSRSNSISSPFSTASGGSEEFSIFVGDLCPELKEDDLVTQFLQPSAWPSSHPFAIAHAHAQQLQGNYGTPAKIRPAPFNSTKSAKVSCKRTSFQSHLT
jgi:hypothetical protein